MLHRRCALKTPLGLYNVREVDSSLGATLETLQASHAAWLRGDASQAMVVDGASIEDLCLTFELPGGWFPWRIQISSRSPLGAFRHVSCV